MDKHEYSCRHTSDLQESLILMKDRLCWSADDIKNLKLNARKVDEVDK